MYEVGTNAFDLVSGAIAEKYVFSARPPFTGEVTRSGIDRRVSAGEVQRLSGKELLGPSRSQLCPSPVGENHIGALFRNHHYRSMGVTGYDCRHDGAVDNSQS
jgi:hypothetical protein